MTLRRGFTLLLWAVALHSALVGLGLIGLGPDVLTRFGFGSVSERFFAVQGGVFHLVMVMFYVSAARDPVGRRLLVRLIVATKTVAFLFLITYYLAVDPIPAVLLSALADGAMAALIALAAQRAT